MKINSKNDIKLLILDVDGVLSDGKIIISNDGNEFKNFDVKDGLGIVILQKLGIKIAIITGKQSNIVHDRFTALGLDPKDIFQNQKNKLDAFKTLKARYSVSNDNVAYMGDDLPDLSIMSQVGLPACPNDSIDIVKKYSKYISTKNGGNGAVRELCEYILKESGHYNEILEKFVHNGGIS